MSDNLCGKSLDEVEIILTEGLISQQTIESQHTRECRLITEELKKVERENAKRQLLELGKINLLFKYNQYDIFDEKIFIYNVINVIKSLKELIKSIYNNQEVIELYNNHIQPFIDIYSSLNALGLRQTYQYFQNKNTKGERYIDTIISFSSIYNKFFKSP
jgi:hypothetical protein